MSKFNEQDVLNIQSKILALKDKSTDINNQRSDLQLTISDINNEIKECCNPKKKDKLFRQRTALLESLKKCESEKHNLKFEIEKLSILQNEIKLEIKNEKLPNVHNLIEDLELLKGYYLDFSADKSRVSSMRIMASEFANKIDKLIKK